MSTGFWSVKASLQQEPGSALFGDGRLNLVECRLQKFPSAPFGRAGLMVVLRAVEVTAPCVWLLFPVFLVCPQQNWSHAHRLNTLDHWFSITECKGSKLYVLLGKWAQLKVKFIHNQGQFSSLVWSGKLDCVVTWMTNGFGELTLLPLPDLWAATIWFIKLVYKVQIEADYQQAVNVFSLLHVPWT